MRFIMYSSNFILTKNQISIIYFIFIFFLFPMFDSNSKELVQSEKNFKKDFEIAAECLALFPNILYNFFDRRTCVEENIKMRDLEVEKENLVKFRKLREERARTCIIDDFERFEKIFFSIRHALRQEFEKDEEDKEFKRTKTILADILKHNNFDISVPEDNANFRLLKFEIPTICDSEFKFTGLLFFTNGVLGYLRFFPSYIPNGNSDFIEKYNNTVVENFIQERSDRATLKIQIEIEKNKLEKKMNRLNQIADFNRSGYIYENNNRCRIWIDKLFPEYEIFWTGECDSDGLVYGKGKVKISYLKDNVKFNSTIDAVFF